MKRKLVLCLAVCLLLAGLGEALAQTSEPEGPPKVLQILREEVKPGKGAAHEKVEAGWPRAFANANWPNHYLAMTSVTGPNEAWFLEGFDSFAAWEKDRQNIEKTPALQTELDRLSAQDGELLSNLRTIAAVYREDLSYRPNIKIAEMRYMQVTTYRVRPGYDTDFTEARKIVNAGHEKANMDEHWATFQVISGAPAGTYLLFIPMKSLEQVDAAPVIHGKPYQDALGETNQNKLREMTRAGTLSTETNLFAFSPKMSYVPKEWAAADPDFWAPKRAAKPVPPAKKESPAPAGTQ